MNPNKVLWVRQGAFFYYGPTMNAFEAAEKNGRVASLQKQLDDLFVAQNKRRCHVDPGDIPSRHR